MIYYVYVRFYGLLDVLIVYHLWYNWLMYACTDLTNVHMHRLDQCFCAQTWPMFLSHTWPMFLSQTWPIVLCIDLTNVYVHRFDQCICVQTWPMYTCINLTSVHTQLLTNVHIHKLDQCAHTDLHTYDIYNWPKHLISQSACVMHIINHWRGLKWSLSFWSALNKDLLSIPTSL